MDLDDKKGMVSITTSNGLRTWELLEKEVLRYADKENGIYLHFIIELLFWFLFLGACLQSFPQVPPPAFPHYSLILNEPYNPNSAASTITQVGSLHIEHICIYIYIYENFLMIGTH